MSARRQPVLGRHAAGKQPENIDKEATHELIKRSRGSGLSPRHNCKRKFQLRTSPTFTRELSAVDSGLLLLQGLSSGVYSTNLSRRTADSGKVFFAAYVFRIELRCSSFMSRTMSRN